jgi:acetoin utilization protein AcuB
MKVSQLMTRKLITVQPMDSVEEAVKLLRRRGVRHLLVMQKGRLVGIVSDRDIKRALDPAQTRKRVMAVGGLYFLLEPILVEEIMTCDPVTIAPSASVQEAACLMLEHRFGALPVLDGKLPAGIITETDVLRYFASMKDEGNRAKDEGRRTKVGRGKKGKVRKKDEGKRI